MKIDQELWNIRKLIDAKNAINLNPMWQRGPTWQQARQVLLVDSILRGMDIPKIYLRVMACPSSEVLGQWGFGFSGGLGSSGVDI